MSTISGFVVHVNRVLTTISAMYRNGSFVADQIFPLLPVEKQSDLFMTYGKDSLRSIDDNLVPLSKSNEINMSRATTPYFADGHALSFPLADEDKANDDLMDLEIDVTTALCDMSFLNREINCLNAITAGITTTIDLSASSYANSWDNPTGQWYRHSRRATQIEFLNYYAQQLICPDAGVLFTNAIS